MKWSPIQMPFGEESSFSGVIDLLKMNLVVWDEDVLGARYRVDAVPPEALPAAQAARVELLERLSESDDLFLEEYLEGRELTIDRIKAVLRSATLQGSIVPVLCGAAFKNKGIQLLLDAVVDFLPSPGETPPITAVQPNTGDYVSLTPGAEEPFSARSESNTRSSPPR